MLKLESFDLFDETGMFFEEFDNLLTTLSPSVRLPRRLDGKQITAAQLAPCACIALALCWLREGGSYRRISTMFHVSRSFVSRELDHIIPKLYCALDEICWPSWWQSARFEGVSAAIDCTPHYRKRVHPRQGDWYRGDKHAHFMSAQVVCSLSGRLLNVQLLQGHNNDQGAFALTRAKEYVEEHELYWLADSGYTHHRLLTPKDEKGRAWNNKQKQLRSVVEVVIGLVKTFRSTAELFSLSPEKQELVVMCCYQLTNINLTMYPLRTNDKF